MNRYDRTLAGIHAKARADAVAGTRRMYARDDFRYYYGQQWKRTRAAIEAKRELAAKEDLTVEERERLRQLDIQIAGEPSVVLTPAQVDGEQQLAADVLAKGGGRG